MPPPRFRRRVFVWQQRDKGSGWAGVGKGVGFSFRVAGVEVSSAGAPLKQRASTAKDAAGAGAQAEGVPSTGVGSEKYQRILDAAVEVIAENGYFNSPVSAIAARAGVADGTVYLYFKSKDEVLRTAIDRNFDRFHRQGLERFQT